MILLGADLTRVIGQGVGEDVREFISSVKVGELSVGEVSRITLFETIQIINLLSPINR